jgi:hypothetical protein
VTFYARWAAFARCWRFGRSWHGRLRRLLFRTQLRFGFKYRPQRSPDIVTRGLRTCEMDYDRRMSPQNRIWMPADPG